MQACRVAAACCHLLQLPVARRGWRAGDDSGGACCSCVSRCAAGALQVLQLEAGNTWAPKVVADLGPEVQRRQEKLKEEMLGACAERPACRAVLLRAVLCCAERAVLS